MKKNETEEVNKKSLDKYNILGKGNDATKDDARHGNEKRSSMVKKNETEEVDEQYSWSFRCHAEFWSFGCHSEFWKIDVTIKNSTQFHFQVQIVFCYI